MNKATLLWLGLKRYPFYRTSGYATSRLMFFRHYTLMSKPLSTENIPPSGINRLRKALEKYDPARSEPLWRHFIPIPPGPGVQAFTTLVAGAGFAWLLYEIKIKSKLRQHLHDELAKAYDIYLGYITHRIDVSKENFNQAKSTMFFRGTRERQLSSLEENISSASRALLMLRLIYDTVESDINEYNNNYFTSPLRKLFPSDFLQRDRIKQLSAIIKIIQKVDHANKLYCENRFIEAFNEIMSVQKDIKNNAYINLDGIEHFDDELFVKIKKSVFNLAGMIEKIRFNLEGSVEQFGMAKIVSKFDANILANYSAALLDNVFYNLIDIDNFGGDIDKYKYLVNEATRHAEMAYWLDMEHPYTTLVLARAYALKGRLTYLELEKLINDKGQLSNANGSVVTNLKNTIHENYSISEQLYSTAERILAEGKTVKAKILPHQYELKVKINKAILLSSPGMSDLKIQQAIKIFDEAQSISAYNYGYASGYLLLLKFVAILNLQEKKSYLHNIELHGQQERAMKYFIKSITDMEDEQKLNDNSNKSDFWQERIKKYQQMIKLLEYLGQQLLEEETKPQLNFNNR